MKYCKIPIISPGLIFVQRLFWWAYNYIQEGFFLEGVRVGGRGAYDQNFTVSIHVHNDNIKIN